MKISELLNENQILVQQDFKSKAEVFENLIKLLLKNGIIKDQEEFKKAIYDRENLTPTAIENGVVIPHAKSATVCLPGIVACTLSKAIDCKAFDKKKSDLFIMIAVPDGSNNEHLQILKQLMTSLSDDVFLANLKAAKSSKAFINLFINK